MYAVIRTGGKQYRVSEGDVIDVEKLEGNSGDELAIDEVLFLGGEGGYFVGKPFVQGASVTAKIVQTAKMEKVIIYKYKAKKDYRKKQGHRQPYTRLEILSVKGSASEEKKAAE
jgi:large subunit ribosomal protein L21